ncbi:NLP/P60-family protein [Streptomyces pristinaespiralis ATCC 25486]|uniref:NLP/P60-family protein n=2 Tax=Streptomyces pristinaespiralis TaxID=38300 RepID=B5HDM0_STRE2|nr:NLP/P60-family protein [Streptomyces pristinaespiralis ATCC 25486]
MITAVITLDRFARYGVNKGPSRADSEVPVVTVAQHTFLEGNREALIAVVLMSHTAHIPSHRKPRRSASKMAIRAGVAGGFLSTIAVAGAAGPANAEPVTETIEMPLLTADSLAAVAQSAEATQQVALDLELQAQLQAQEEAAAAKAAKAAEKAKAEADRAAEAKEKEEAKKRAEAAAQERASRDSERTTLSASASTGTATGSAATVVAFLKAQLGDAYIMGATGPNAWDCSSLVQAAYRTVGIDLPRVSQDQSLAGTQVGTSNLQVGDILYWGGAGSAYHTGVYIGDGQYLDAANPSKGVVIQDLSGYPASGAVRVL